MAGSSQGVFKHNGFTMKQLLIIGVSLVVGFITGSYWASPNNISANITSNAIDTKNADIVQLQNHNANLQLENNSLRQRLIAKQSSSQLTTQNSTSSATSASGNQAEHELAIVELEMTAEKIHNTLRNNNYNSSYLAKNFENEKTDYAWAEAEQQKLSNWFINNHEFSGLALREVSCRTTQCKISVAANTNEQANEILTKLSSVLSENYKSSLHFADTDIASGKTTLYISFAQDQ